MTFISLTKKRSLLHPLVIALAFLVVGEAITLVFMYTQTVNMRDDIRVVTGELKASEAHTIELRNALYARLDAKNLFSAAEKAGLLLEKRPRYLELDDQSLAAGYHP